MVRFNRSSDEQICQAVDVKRNSAHLYISDEGEQTTRNSSAHLRTVVLN